MFFEDNTGDFTDHGTCTGCGECCSCLLPVTKEEINRVFEQAAAEPYYEGILTVTHDELVSTDFRGNSHSAIVDLPLTDVVGGNLIKVVAWYDNEWGYSNRLVELSVDFGREA